MNPVRMAFTIVSPVFGIILTWNFMSVPKGMPRRSAGQFIKAEMGPLLTDISAFGVVGL